MNDDQEKAKFWLNVSGYYQKKLADPIMKMYVFDCKDVSLVDLKKAFVQYRQGPKAEFFPIPAVLKTIINPPPDEFAEANECAAKIFEAIRRFGYDCGLDAKPFMGELAWSCVDAMGGWYHICTSPSTGNDASMRAQIRDIAKSKMIRAQQGRTNQLPGQGIKALLPSTPQKSLACGQATEKVNALVSDVLDGKSLDEDVRGTK